MTLKVEWQEGHSLVVPALARGQGMGRGASSPADYGSGKCRKLPSRVRGGAPAENGFWCILILKEPMW